VLPLTFSERVHLPRIPFITLPCTFAPASAVSAPTLAGGGGERAETEGWTNRQDTRSHIAHLLESLLASHGRIVFTARTRPAFRSPQSLRRPPDDVTALTLLVVMMTSPGGCTPAAPAALPREEGCRKANAFLCTPPPFQPGSSLHHHLRGPLAHPFL
jgi:hypothetical protein